MRILGLDYGDKSIGVSVSDADNKIAFPLETIFRDKPESLKKSFRRLEEIIKEYSVNKIVLGYPKNMNNTEGERCEKTKEFERRLHNNFKKTEVVLWDERLSTSFSMRALHEGNASSEKISSSIDNLAAVYILQGYLDFCDRQNKQQT